MGKSLFFAFALLAVLCLRGYGSDTCHEPLPAADGKADCKAMAPATGTATPEADSLPSSSIPFEVEAGAGAVIHDPDRDGECVPAAADGTTGEWASPDVKPSHAPSLPGLELTPDEFFSNACQPPLLHAVHVPKTKPELERKLGADFRVVRRGAFLLAGDLEEESFRQLVDGVFMCCLACLQHDYFKKPVTQTVTIYIFQNSESYREGLHTHFRMNPISPYGHYGHRQRYIVVNYETGPGTLVHELTHALMAVDFPEAPIWISEGIASLYEQSRVEGDSLKGEPNWRLPELQAALANGGLTPLRNLLSMDVRTFRRRNESLHYAQSRYFCKYAESLGHLRPLYARFRDSHVSDPTGVISVEAVFGKSIEEIEEEFHAWLRTRRWHPPTAHQGN